MSDTSTPDQINVLITAGFIEKPLRAVNREFAGKIAKEIKKTLKINSNIASQELNTWLLHYTMFDRELTPDIIASFESKIHNIFISYHDTNIIKLLKRDIQTNRELKETTKIITNFLEIINPNLVVTVKSKISALQQEIPILVKEIIKKNIVILWQNRKDFRFQFNESSSFDFSQADLSNELDLVQLIDKAIIFNFFSTWADPTIKLIQNINAYLSSLFTFLMNHNKVNLTDDVVVDKFVLYIRIIVAKLSSLEQITSVLQRIYSLHDSLKQKLLEVADPSLLEKIHLKEQFDSQNSISKVALQLLRSVEEKNNYCKNQLRDYTREPDEKLSLEQFKEGFREFVTITSGIFVESERLKIWTDKFQDVPYFTFSSSLFSDLLDKQKEIQMDSNIILSIKGLFKTYNLGATTVYAIRGMDLDIRKGEFLVIFGTSGAGKTTLLNCMAGLDSPDKGVVYFRGKNLHQMKDKDRSTLRLEEMGFIFQNYALLPHYTAKENVSLPGDMIGLSTDTRKRINDLLSGVGIDLQSKQFPAQLSGGQMQRVGIARALTNQPTIIFADEPTGDLDSVTGVQVLDLLKKFHEETGTTIVVITHDQSVADYATRVVTVNDGLIISDSQKN